MSPLRLGVVCRERSERTALTYPGKGCTRWCVWPFRKRPQHEPAVEASVAAVYAEMAAKQAEASAKLLTAVMDAADRSAARALGRRRASGAKRRADGRFAPNAYHGPETCRVCRNMFDSSLTADEIMFHNSGHARTNG